jgi:hypothetical protein
MRISALISIIILPLILSSPSDQQAIVTLSFKDLNHKMKPVPVPGEILELRWNFNEGKGSLLKEASGKEPGGNIHNARWTAGIEGSALKFNGEDTFIEYGRSEMLNFCDLFTVELWINPDVWMSEDCGIAGQHSDDKRRGWAIQYDGWSNLLFFWININNRTETLAAPAPVTDEWHYIAATWDGKKISLFVDGIIKGSKSVSGLANNSGEKLVIGRLFENRPGNGFRGSIDQVRITNGHLEEKEIKASYLSKGGVLNEFVKTPGLMTGNYPASLFIEDSDNRRAENPDWFYNVRSFTWRKIPAKITFQMADSVLRDFASYGINAIFPEGYRYLFAGNEDGTNWFNSLPFEEYIQNLKIITDACHKNRMKLIGHLTACCVLKSYYDSHQDQSMTDLITGEKAFFQGYNTYMMCPNNPGFQKNFLDRIYRLVNETGMDGLMVDETEWLPPEWTICGCKYCHIKFREKTGFEVPDPNNKKVWGNYLDPRWRAWLNFRIESMGDFLVSIKETIDQCGRGKLFTGCYCEALYPGAAGDYGIDLEDMHRGLNTSFFECEPANPWSWRYNFAEAKYYAAFGPCIYLGYSASYTQQFFSWAFAKTNGFGLWIWPEVEKVFPYQWEKKWEEMLSSHEPLCNIALLFSSATKNLKRDAFYSTEEYAGWAEVLTEEHIPFETVIARDLSIKNLKKFNKIILPDVACLSESQTEILKNYVKGGGHLIMTAGSSLLDETGKKRKNFSLNRIIGLSFKEYLPSIDSISPFTPELEGITGKIISYNGNGILTAKKSDDIEVLARIKESGSPAITLSKFGNGDVIYIAFRPGSRYYMPKIGGSRTGEGGSWKDTRIPEFRDLITYLSTKNVTLPLYTENIPPEIIINPFVHSYNGYDGIIIHMLNCTGTSPGKIVSVPAEMAFEFTSYPSPVKDKGKPMKIKYMGNDVKKAYLVSPDFKQVVSLKCKTGDGYCEIKIPDIGRYQVVYLVKEGRDIILDITRGESIEEDFPGVTPFEPKMK